jgi:hypothetical protein
VVLVVFVAAGVGACGLGLELGVGAAVALVASGVAAPVGVAFGLLWTPFPVMLVCGCSRGAVGGTCMTLQLVLGSFGCLGPKYAHIR